MAIYSNCLSSIFVLFISILSNISFAKAQDNCISRRISGCNMEDNCVFEDIKYIGILNYLGRDTLHYSSCFSLTLIDKKTSAVYTFYNNAFNSFEWDYSLCCYDTLAKVNIADSIIISEKRFRTGQKYYEYKTFDPRLFPVVSTHIWNEKQQLKFEKQGIISENQSIQSHHGLIREWNENGTLAYEENYYNGIRCGWAAYYHENGSPYQFGYLLGENWQGWFVECFNNGMPKKTGLYVLGKKHHVWFVFNKNGQLINIERWYMGSLIKSERPENKFRISLDKWKNSLVEIKILGNQPFVTGRTMKVTYNLKSCSLK